MKNNYTQLLNTGEEVVMIVRKHPIGVTVIAGAVAAFSALIAAGFYVVGRYPDKISIVGSPQIALVILSILLVLVLLIGFAAYRVYTQSYLMITSQNIFQFVQSGLLSGVTSQMKLAEVEDAKAEQNGLFATTFNYGDTTIETAGAQENFIFSFVPNPGRVVDTILDLSRECARKEAEEAPK